MQTINRDLTLTNLMNRRKAIHLRNQWGEEDEGASEHYAEITHVLESILKALPDEEIKTRAAHVGLDSDLVFN